MVSRKKSVVPAWKRRVEEASAALAKLSNVELEHVLLREFNRRRIGNDGKLTDKAGQYEAATTSMRALLGNIRRPKQIEAVRQLDPVQAEFDARQAMLADRLAAVGRGALVYTKDQDFAELVRELAGWVAGWVTWSIPEIERAPRFARTLGERFGVPVDDALVAKVSKALKYRSTSGRVTNLAMALRPKVTEDKMGTGVGSRAAVQQRVKDILKL